MRFSEKLGFLMDVTKTTNSALSLYVSLDASYISRLRSGKRLAPRNENIIRRMAAYFARNCSEEYRKKTLEDVLGIHPLPGDKNALAEAIALWLLKEKERGADTVGRFLGSLAELQGRKEQSEKPEKKERPYPRDETAVYYGVEGKRQAVLYFLSEVLTQEKAQTLFLFSDEETSWMTADPGFTEKWAGLMTSILSSGHRIKIIHTVSRDLNEMLSAIGQWMPLYMTGSIEPFFYPKKRDGVFHHTLFIARGTAAVVSGSVGGNTKRAVNMLFRSAETVSSFEEEFLQYLALCRPLMRAIKAGDTADCLNLLSDFERKQHNTILKTETLSLLTFPEAGVSELFKRGGFDSDRMLEYHRTRIERFRRLVQDVRFDEIIALPEPNDVIAGKIPVALSALLQGGLIYYTRKSISAT